MKDELVCSVMVVMILLEDVRVEEFDVVFYSGGYGFLWDFFDNVYLIKLIEDIIVLGKLVGVVCYVFIVLKDVKVVDGELLVKGKLVIGFMNSEEDVMGLIDVVFYLVEDELVKSGGKFEKVDNFVVKVCIDGLFVIG